MVLTRDMLDCVPNKVAVKGLFTQQETGKEAKNTFLGLSAVPAYKNTHKPIYFHIYGTSVDGDDGGQPPRRPTPRRRPEARPARSVPRRIA